MIRVNGHDLTPGGIEMLLRHALAFAREEKPRDVPDGEVQKCYDAFFGPWRTDERNLYEKAMRGE